jgi:uncharacterized protein (DUF2147 family)
MRKALLPAVTAALLLVTGAAWAADPHGIWQTGDSQARIRIDRCGPGICGSIVWLKDPIDRDTGKPVLDHNNQNEAQRRRALIGLRILNMRPTSEGWSGTIYNSDDGKTYNASITMRGPAALTVRGCMGPFCGDDNWTRTR